MAVTLKEVILNLEPVNWTRDAIPTREEHMTGEATPDTGTENGEEAPDTGTPLSEQSIEDQLAFEQKKNRRLEDQLRGKSSDPEKSVPMLKKQRDALAKEIETLREATMSEQEKAVAAAKSEARTETVREFGTKLVNAEIRVAAKGRVEDVDALIEGVDGSKFLDADGEPDRDAIAAWVERIAPERDGTSLAFPDLGQGARTNGTDKSLSGDPLVQALTAKVGKR